MSGNNDVKEPKTIILGASSESAKQLAAPQVPKITNLSEIDPNTFSSVVDYAASKAEPESTNTARYSAFVLAIQSLLPLQVSVNLACTITTIADTFVYTGGTSFGSTLFHVAAPGNNHIYTASASTN